MKTPAFWQTDNVFSALLLPLSLLYNLAARMRYRSVKSITLPIPVICIGNVTAGGAGKTPVALFIAEKLKKKNINAFFLTRGYGGNLDGPVLVTPEHTAQAVGDEPLLLAQILPTIVAKNRINGADLALSKGAEMIIMDDGFQNPALAKTLSLLVIDGANGFGNSRLLPAGPLRESPASGFARAQGIIVINPGAKMPELPAHKPTLIARTQPKNPQEFTGKRCLAFSGIAYPQKFFATLAATGADICETIAYADHYPYQPSDLQKLAAKARAQNAMLAATAKDACRLPPEFRAQVAVLDIALVFDDEAMLDALLDQALKPYAHI